MTSRLHGREIVNMRYTTKTLATVAGVLAAAAVAGQAEAHHSQAAYFNFDKEVEIEGVVSRFDFRNPHAYLYVDVEEDGEIVTWKIQFGNATGLRRRGWTVDMVDPGVHVTVRGRPARNESEHAIAGAEIILPDGSEFGSNPEE
jgi:hypothetical protein